MKYAVIADIHGNGSALDAILGEISQEESIEGVLVLGDVAVGGPDPCEVVKRLQELENPLCLAGNSDRWMIDGVSTGMFGKSEADINIEAVLSVARMCGWTEALLANNGYMEWIKNLPDRIELALPNGKKALAVHGSPASDEKGFMASTPESEQKKLLMDCKADMVLAGHTHVEYHNQIGNTEIHVIPSAGIPTGPDHSAPYAILEAAGDNVDLHIRKVGYDTKPVIERLKSQNHPGLKRALIAFGVDGS